jgi:hypothetical protein
MKNIFAKPTLALAAAAILIGAPLALANSNDRNDFDRSEVHKLGSELSVQINDNGKTIVRGAKVTAISGPTVSAMTVFGSTTVSWSITTTLSTQFVDKGGRNLGISGIAVGDIVSFSGSLNGSASSLTVAANVVKDWSKNVKQNEKQNEKHTFSGTLQTLPASTTPTTFLLAVQDTTYTVAVPSGISILNKIWLPVSLSTFVLGDRVNVYGAVDASSTSVINASVVRNPSR